MTPTPITVHPTMHGAMVGFFLDLLVEKVTDAPTLGLEHGARSGSRHHRERSVITARPR
jgi:hypothetical protein